MNGETRALVKLVVTPDMAKNWLDSHNRRNRTINKRVVASYAQDMRDNRWDYRFCNPIQFSESGNLANGQHRLMAVVESGVAGVFWVERGVPDDCQLVMDTGAKRNLAQYTKFADLPRAINRNMVATANMMFLGVDGYVRHTIAGQRDFIETHYDALAFAEGCFASNLKGVSTAGVRAAVARAYYHAITEELQKFADVLQLKNNADMGANRSKTVLALRRWLDKNPGAGQATAKKQYRHTEKALAAYLEGAVLSLIRIQSEPVELFPLPEEQD